MGSAENEGANLDKLKVGVIGCGAVSQRGHLPALLNSNKARLVAVADIDNKLAKRTAKRFGVSKAYSDYEDLLRDGLDVVHVCVPNHLHAKVAIQAMNKGINVLVEKPIATRVEDAEEMVRTAQGKRVKLCEVKQWRYIPALKAAYNWYTSGKLGRLVSIMAQWHLEVPLRWTHAQWHYDMEKSGGGIVSNIGVHMLDLLTLFGGPVCRVSASGGDFTGTMGVDSSVQALLEFSGGGSGFLDVSWMAPISKMLEIVGSAGISTVNLQFFSSTRVAHFRNPLKDLFFSARTMVRTAGRVANRDFFNPLPKLYSALFDDYYDSIVYDKTPPVPGPVAVNTLRLKDAIYKSIAEKRSVSLM